MCISELTTDFKHRRTAAFENQRLYGQIECAIGGCLQGIVRPRSRHFRASINHTRPAKRISMPCSLGTVNNSLTPTLELGMKHGPGVPSSVPMRTCDSCNSTCDGFSH